MKDRDEERQPPSGMATVDSGVCPPSPESPFLIERVHAGRGEVVDPVTRQQVGYILRNFSGWWHGYLYGDERHPFGGFRERIEAAEAVWTAHEGRGA